MSRSKDPEYLHTFCPCPTVPSITLLLISDFFSFHIDAHEQSRRTEIAHKYKQLEALYISLYFLSRAAQVTCIPAYWDLQLYTKEAHWSILVPLSRELVDAIHENDLAAHLDG